MQNSALTLPSDSKRAQIASLLLLKRSTAQHMHAYLITSNSLPPAVIREIEGRLPEKKTPQWRLAKATRGSPKVEQVSSIHLRNQSALRVPRNLTQGISLRKCHYYLVCLQ